MQFIQSVWDGVKSACKKAADKAQALAVTAVTAVGSMLGMQEPANAAGPDLTSLTTAVDFGTVITAILGVSAAVIVVYIAWKGAKMVIGAVKSA